MGAFVVFPDKMQQLLQPILTRALQLMTLPDSSTAPATDAATRAPIVIHTGASIDSSSRLVTTVVSYGLGAAAVWLSYCFACQYLPEFITQMLPVTRQVFDKAISNLAKGIINVKESLGKQIASLSRKQDELGTKQDETHQDVVDIKDELGQARIDLASLNHSVDDCVVSLEYADRLQSYTARGVKLLVRCVATVLPTNDRIVTELAQFTKDGEEFRTNNTRRTVETSVSQTPLPTLATNPQERTPENEHPALIATQPPNQLDSVDDINEILGLIREGRIHEIKT